MAPLLRWDRLFADLEAHAAALERAERAAEIEERTRGEIATLGIADRLRAQLGSAVQVSCAGGLTVRGVLRRLGADWVLVDEGVGREALIALDAVSVFSGLGRGSGVPGSDGMVAQRSGIRLTLRAIARDRLPVRIHLRDGAMLDATVERVASDHVDVAVHAVGEARRRNAVRDGDLVAISAIAAVRRLVG